MTKLKRLTVRPVMVPASRPAVTATGTFDRIALVLIDLEADTGAIGRTYLFTFTEPMLKPTVACIEALWPLLENQTAAPDTLDRTLRQRFRLIDTYGILGQALAGINMALWDIDAQTAGLPLARHLGSAVDAVTAYNSCGLWHELPDALGAQASALLDQGGFSALKIRLGRANPADDVAAVRAVKAAMPGNTLLMSDYNQALTTENAIARGRVLDEEGLYWIEEPVRFDDFTACARVNAALNTPVQIGENLRSPLEMTHAIAANAARYYMPDPQRIGGVSGWLRAAALAEAHAFELSSHLFPEICVHLLAASATRHWLEYVDWANPILEDPLEIRDGAAVVPGRPGIGMCWNEAAVKRYAVA
ncbi:MAG: enolase C-terminal domain-like protein [Gammaproteobacteria bacterium]